MKNVGAFLGGTAIGIASGIVYDYKGGPQDAMLDTGVVGSTYLLTRAAKKLGDVGFEVNVDPIAVGAGFFIGRYASLFGGAALNSYLKGFY